MINPLHSETTVRRLLLSALGVAFCVGLTVEASVTFEEGSGVTTVVAGVESEAEAGVVVPVRCSFVTAPEGNALLNYLGLASLEVGPGSTVHANGMRKRGRECLVELETGSMVVSTLALPKRTSLLVRTPLGTCVVTGEAAFSVSYSVMPDSVTEELSIWVTQGEIKISGPFIGTGPEDTLREGGILSVKMVDCIQRSCLYFPAVTVKGQDLSVAFGSQNIILISQDSTVEAAMNAAPEAAPFVSFLVTKDSVAVEGLEITSGMVAGYVEGSRLVMGSEGQLPEGTIVHPKLPTDLIEVHDGTSLTIAGREFDSDVLLFPDKAMGGQWLRSDGQFLARQLKTVPLEGVEDLIVGSGPESLIGMPSEVLDALRESGVSVEVLPTDRAILEYNRRIEEGGGGALGAAIILEDYMNADDYLAAAREAAADYANLIAGGGIPFAGAPLPVPAFMSVLPLTTEGGARFRPDGSDGGIMTNFAPPPLNILPPLPPLPPIDDVCQSPGPDGECLDDPPDDVCYKTITITVQDTGSITSFGGGCSYCCFSGFGGGGLYQKRVYPTKDIEIRIPVPCYVAGPGRAATRGGGSTSRSASQNRTSLVSSLPPLPGSLDCDGGCSLNY